MQFFSYILSPDQILTFYGSALLIGMAKTGVQGAGMMAVPIVASIFGGINSSGILLPILCIADVLGIIYYHRHASWSHLRALFPTTAIGTIIGVIVGTQINDIAFKIMMAIAIIISIGVMIWLEQSNGKKVSHAPWFAGVIGLLAGFTSMVGNLAGPLMAVYFLSMRLPKKSFIGTAAWFFLVINFFKIPFHIFAWKTVTTQTVIMDLTTLPVVVIGALLGIYIVKNFSEKNYRWFVIATTLIAAVVMLL